MRECYNKDKLSDGQLSLLIACKFNVHGFKGTSSCDLTCYPNIKVAMLNNDLNFE